MTISKCINCGKECIKHAKGMCVTCYKKLVWKPQLKECNRCHREKPHHAKGFCAGCYNTVFHLDKTKERNHKKYHNIDLDLYKEKTKECLVCGFNKAVDLHHLDKNKKNNSKDNLIGLCPNHHKMLHTLKYNEEIQSEINKKMQVKTSNQS